MKNKKIEDIKNISEFYQALKGIVVNRFYDFERVEAFDGMTEKQKRYVLEFGYVVLAEVYNPIQKRYTKQTRKKYEKILKEKRR